MPRSFGGLSRKLKSSSGAEFCRDAADPRPARIIQALAAAITSDAADRIEAFAGSGHRFPFHLIRREA